MSIDLKTFFEKTQVTLTTNPQAGRLWLCATSQQVDGLCSHTKIRKFDVTIDEPPGVGGTDQGPSPVELVLAAFGACQEITYRLYADKMGIPLNRVSVSVRGHLNLRGFLDVDDEVRPGFETVEASVTLDSPASEDELARLVEKVAQHCPVLDLLHNGVPVKLDIAHVNESVREAVT